MCPLRFHRVLFAGLIAATFSLPLASGAQTRPTPDFYGMLGLNTVPNARMDPVGTVRATASRLRPFASATVGVQIAAPFYIALRQSGTGTLSRTDALYPGMDVKLRLQKEGPVAPAVAVGLQSAVGQARLAGEYLVTSKRFYDFDFSLGTAWGQPGEGSLHLPNALRFAPHFDRSRPRNGVRPNTIDDWFTGHTFGLIGGVEYDVRQLPGFALKADYGANRLTAGDLDDGRPPKYPWSVGASYSPFRWLSVGTAFIGGDRFMTTVSLQTPSGGWPLAAVADDDAIPLSPARAGDAEPGAMERSASTAGLTLYKPRVEGRDAYAFEDIDDVDSLPLQLGRAARPMANNAGEAVSEIVIVPVHDGLRGPAIALTRDDLEAAMARHSGSPQEIWQHARFGAEPPPLEDGSTWYPRFADDRPLWQRFSPRLHFDNQVSLADRDKGLFYYSSLVGGVQRQLGAHGISGADLRLNLADNLSGIRALRPQSLNPVRSDIAGFAGMRVGLDRLYGGWLTSLTPNVHFGATAGLLEQMYSGAGTEILYRPFGKTYAVGAEAYIANKRNYRAALALGPTGQSALTGFLNFHYEIPTTAMTVHLKLGRYLAGDVGGTLSLDQQLDNGVRIGGFVTATNRSDVDAFGGGTNLYSGVRITLPFGGVPYLPRRSDASLTAAPIGRDAGQQLDAPLPLYEVTEPLSYRQITRHWTDITR